MNDQLQIYVKTRFDLYNDNFDFHQMVPPLNFERMIFRVTRGSTFSPMEKLIKPFDFPTWTLSFVTFVVGFFVIFLISQLPKIIQDFVFGESVQFPSYNLVQIFFGIGLTILPDRNFSRFIFLMFTILCLVLRTAYQGKMYDFLQYNIRHTHAESIQEIIDREIPVYFYEPSAFENDYELKKIW